MSALAIQGGSPVLTQPGPHFTWPPITEATSKAVQEQLHSSISIYDRSGVIADLEDALKEYFNVRHAVLTSSGTAAIHSAYASSYIEPGDEVIVPCYTFLATVTPLLHLGGVPVLADSDETGNVSAADVANRITPKTTAIMVTHLWGIPADMIALEQLGHLDDYPDGRDYIARYICDRLRDLPGIVVPALPDGDRAAWYGLPLTYVPEELDELPVESFYAALLAEGLAEVDQPGSTCPLNRLPLFRDPKPLLTRYGYTSDMSYDVGQFPVAERVWRHTLKLPVWHREEDLPLIDRYIDGFRKVIDNHHELLGR